MAEKKVGVQFVAEGEEQASAALLSAEKAAERYNSALLALAQAQARGQAIVGDLAGAEKTLTDALDNNQASLLKEQSATNQLLDVQAQLKEQQQRTTAAINEQDTAFQKFVASGQAAAQLAAQRVEQEKRYQEALQATREAEAQRGPQAFGGVVDTGAEERLKANIEAIRQAGGVTTEYIEILKNMGATEEQIIALLTQEEKAQLSAAAATAENAKSKTTYEAALKALMSTGIGTAEAAERITKAEAEGVSLDRVRTDALKERDTILKSLVQGSLNLAEAQAALSEQSQKESVIARELINAAKERQKEERLVEEIIRKRAAVAEQAAIKEAEAYAKEEAALERLIGAEEQRIGFSSRVQTIIQLGSQFGATGREMRESLIGIGLNAEAADTILKQYGITVEQDAKRHALLSESAIHTSRAFFALTLASFGLMTIEKDLKQAFGEDLPPALQKTVSVIQEIASFGSAGAFSGIPGGAIAGGILGLILGLGTAALSVSPEIEQLNQQLNNLGKKDEVVDTLAQITDWTRQESQAMLELAKSSPEVGKALEQFARAKEPMSELQAAIKGVGVEWNKIQEIIAKDPQLFAAALAGPVGVGFVLAMRQLGIDAGEALVKGLRLASPEIGLVIDEFAQLTTEGKAAQAMDEAVAASLLKEAQAGAEAAKQIDTLLKSLQQVSSGDAKTQLEGIANVTEDVATRFTKFAEAHRDVATEAAGLVQKIQDEQVTIAKLQQTLTERPGDPILLHILQQTTKDMQSNEQALHDLVTANQDYSDILKQVADAQDKLNQSLEDATQRLSQLNERTQNQLDAAQQQYNNTVANAARARQDAITNSEQQLTDRIADLWQDLQNKIVDVNSQLADRVADINMQLGNRIADIQMQLQDKLEQIDLDLANKREQLQHQYQDNLNKANASIEQAAEDLARKLYEIERQRLESIEQLDFNTALQLETAKTDHDRDRILRQRQFELAQINQRANDARDDARNTFEQKVADAEKERELAKRNYDYELALAEKLADQKRAEARETAAQQITAAQRQAQQQIAIAQREAEQAIVLAERRYEEEKERAVRSFNEQVAAAQRAEQNKLQDAARALAERNDAITKSNELERQQIEYTKQKALQAYQEVIAAIKNMIEFVKAFIQVQLEAIGLSAFMAKTGAGIMANLTGDWAKGIQGAIGGGLNAGGAQGLELDVPMEAKYSNDRYLIGASPGEHVSITPANTYNTSSRAMSVSFVINDASDPQRVAQHVKRILNDVAFGMG